MSTFARSSHSSTYVALAARFLPALILMRFFTVPAPLYAAVLENPITDDTLYCFLVHILEAFVMVVFPILVLALVYAGYQFVAAQGNPSELTKARMYFVWCAVGALVILGAQTLAFAIEGTVSDIYESAGLVGELTSGRGACD